MTAFDTYWDNIGSRTHDIYPEDIAKRAFEAGVRKGRQIQQPNDLLEAMILAVESERERIAEKRSANTESA